MKFFKYCITFSFSFIFLLMFSSCQLDEYKNDKITVVTTIFPLYDFTRQIVKDKIDVKLILPPGYEPHTFDPKPRSIFEIRNADMFIYTGEFLEVWANKIIEVLDEDSVTVINSSQGIGLLSHDENHHASYDPHIWLDPNNAIIMVDNILEGIVKIDPENKQIYEQNANYYKDELEKLDLAYRDLFENTRYNTIIFSGHFVFGYLANRYGIEYISPYKGFSPDTLPTPRKVQELINVIHSTGVQIIYYEELIEPRVARVISSETGVKMLPLNGAGNISKEDFNQNVTYLSIMYKNIDNLKKGLIYNE